MKNYMEKMTKKYVNSVRDILPFIRKNEREYLKNLEREIKGYIEANRMTEFKYVIDKFGSPYDIALDYVNHYVDSETMVKMRKRSKFAKIAVVATTAVVSAAVAGVCIYKKSTKEN